MDWLVATQVVFADLISGAKDFKIFASSLGVGLVILALAFAVVKDDTRKAWRSSPLIVFMILLGAAAGITALRSLGLSFLDLISGG